MKAPIIPRRKGARLLVVGEEGGREGDGLEFEDGDELGAHHRVDRPGLVARAEKAGAGTSTPEMPGVMEDGVAPSRSSVTRAPTPCSPPRTISPLPLPARR
jgi:hypothetical protein